MEDKKTIEYYNANAGAFISGTRDVMFTEVQDRFLTYLTEGSSVLDFGCGSGRDTKYFLSRGFAVEAIDGSEELCRLAAEYTGIEVKHMYFEELDACDRYDGIWACSSILHCNHESLMTVFKLLHKALKDNGVLYASFKYGEYEGERNGRYFIYLTETSIVPYLEGYRIEEQWISSDVRPGRDDEKWLNVILRKK